MKEKIFNAFRIIVLAFILSSAIGYSLADWTPPSGTPPFNNVPPPINVGPTTQVKDGNLFLNNWLIAKKAQSIDSTVGDSGCSPEVPGVCDSGKTLTTKDYVDGKVGAVGPLRIVTSTSTRSPTEVNTCSECPHGFYSWSATVSSDGHNFARCKYKIATGEVVVPPESIVNSLQVPLNRYLCFSDLVSLPGAPFQFITY